MRQPLLAAFLLLSAGCLSVAGPPPQGLDAAVLTGEFAGLTGHAALVERLAAMEVAGVAVDVVGRSVEGRDIHLVRVGQGPFELWLAARHHGNEPTSTEAVLNTLDYLLGRREPGEGALPVTRELHAHRALLLERLTFVIVPMVNPDGAEAYQRRNVNGQDLNRDYLLFKEPESRAVRDAFWRAWPDAGLDLHNEGLTPQYDYDAFYPEVPRAEEESQALSLRNQWLTVAELEASGAYGGGPNENYVASSLHDPCQYAPVGLPIPPPTGDTDPTAYCEGTHDAFLTLRGAPGWTPEAAIGWDDAASPTLPWAVRLHEATIASTAFLYAGLYDGCAPRVQKFAGTLQRDTMLPVQTLGPARFQLVWRDDAARMDQNLDELDLALRTPSGRALGPETHPLGYTETLLSDEAGTHAARITSRAPLPTAYELRVHECVPEGTGLEVERAPGALTARNTGTVALMVEVQESLIGAHAVRAPGAEVRQVQGNLAPKTVVAWRLALEPGEARTLAYEAPAGASAGPARWHAHAPGGAVLLGVGEERGSPAPG